MGIIDKYSDGNGSFRLIIGITDTMLIIILIGPYTWYILIYKSTGAKI